MAFDHKAYHHEYYLKNKAKLIAQNKAWRDKNCDRAERTRKAYVAANADKIRKWHRANNEKNKESIRKQRAEYYTANRDALNAKNMERYRTKRRALGLLVRADETDEQHQARERRKKEKRKAYRLKNRENMRAWHRKHQIKNKERLNAISRAYHATHRSEHAAYVKQYWKEHTDLRKKTRATERESSKKRYAADPAYKKLINARSRDWKARNWDRVLKYARDYGRTHADGNASRYMVRRARKMSVANEPDKDFFRKVVIWFRTEPALPCYWCGKKTLAGKRRRHIDHIIPLAKRGGNTVYNLCCSCPTCNHRKHAKLPHEFTGQYELTFQSHSPPSP